MMTIENELHYFRPDWVLPSDQTVEVDLCVYGGCAGGIVAAVTAARRGLSALVLQPGRFLGGMTTGGLGWTDTGSTDAIGGAAGAFYREVGAQYGKDVAWCFAPSAAQAVLDRLIASSGIRVRLCQYLQSLEMDGQRIASLTMLGGLRVKARQFIDATYEGDLLALAGVGFTLGREGNEAYGETLNGIQVRNTHQFSHFVDPYVTPGEPASGPLPWIDEVDRTKLQGQGDRLIQAYNFRVCMTDDPDLKVPWQRPDRYDPAQFELARRWFNAEKDAYNEHVDPERPTIPRKFDVLPNQTPGGHVKTDTNNHGPVSSDFIGANHDWPTATYERREAIFQAHVDYQMGFYWFMANHPEIPDRYRQAYQRWGLARDEFPRTGHWPHQLYVREGRRMVGDYVITQHDCEHRTEPEDPIGLASYTMDSHNCSRFISEGRVLNDGDVQVKPTGPYPISYRAIVPKRGQCENLLVPVCLSASHIAFGSVRMEPVFMILGESAALAASIAIRKGLPVQDVPYDELRSQMDEAGQIVSV